MAIEIKGPVGIPDHIEAAFDALERAADRVNKVTAEARADGISDEDIETMEIVAGTVINLAEAVVHVLADIAQVLHQR